MAAKKLVDTTMNSWLFLLLLLVPAIGARYVNGGAIETQAGIMPKDGQSPLPTEAPGLNGIPNELRRRDIALPEWCGLVDGNPADIVSCAPSNSCVLQSNFYFACCNSLNTDLCFNSNYVQPTTCFDYSIWALYASISTSTVACSNLIYPYCLTITSSGLSPQFVCTDTIYPRIHSFVPITAYLSSLTATTPSITLSEISPTSPTPEPTNDDDSNNLRGKKFKLPPSAKAGIGSGVSLVTIAVIAIFGICFRRKRKRAHIAPTDSGTEPVMAQTNNTPKDDQSAAQPVQHEYQLQPQGYQGAILPVQQQYQPPSQGYQNSTQQYQPQLNNTKFPDSVSPPYFPAPIYSSGSQHTSAALIPPNEPTSDPKIASHYPSTNMTPASPLSPNPSHQAHQQQQNTAPSWDYPPNSPVSTLGPERSNLHHQEIPPGHSELGIGELDAQHHTGTSWNHSELPGAGEARAHYSGPLNNNHSELGP